MPTTAAAQTSLLMLAMGLLVASLSAYVFVGWMRTAFHETGWGRARAVVVAVVVFGSGLSVAAVLALGGESLAFPIGFSWLRSLGLWLGGIALMVPMALWLTYRPGTAAAIICGALMAGLAAGLHLGWISAIGFRPGLVWRPEMVALGWLIMVGGFGTALTVGLPGPGRRQPAESWRLAGAFLLGMSMLAAEAAIHAGANLQTQVGSIYRHELPASLLALVSAALCPLALLILAVELELRRRDRRRHRSRRRSRYRRGEVGALAQPGAAEGVAHPTPPASA